VKIEGNNPAFSFQSSACRLFQGENAGCFLPGENSKLQTRRRHWPMSPSLPLMIKFAFLETCRFKKCIIFEIIKLLGDFQAFLGIVVHVFKIILFLLNSKK